MTEKMQLLTEKRVAVGSQIEIVGDYRGFLMDLAGYVGEVRAIYTCKDEVRYITYLPAIDEYVEPTIKNIKFIESKEEEEIDYDSERSISPSGSLCA